MGVFRTENDTVSSGAGGASCDRVEKGKEEIEER